MVKSNPFGRLAGPRACVLPFSAYSTMIFSRMMASLNTDHSLQTINQIAIHTILIDDKGKINLPKGKNLYISYGSPQSV